MILNELFVEMWPFYWQQKSDPKSSERTERL